MATKDTSSSFLSRMVRFVRHPTTDWSALDEPAPEPEPEPESGYSKQALKAMIESKRQNDFVRRREFDQLRKLRRNGLLISPELAGRPSFFQASTTSNLDERAMTLKKIDEIEAQMSKQWWKGKEDKASVQGEAVMTANPLPVAGDRAPRSVELRGAADTFAPTQARELSPEFDSGEGVEYESTRMGLSTPDYAAPRAGGSQPTVARSAAGSRNFDAGLNEFSTSKLVSIELGQGLADAELEEAAIRFANGDDAGAEAGLLAALHADNVHPDAADGWAAALFDLYRATGQQASFDGVAIDYAERFGRSAPAWFSTPDLLGRKSAALPLDQLAARARARQMVWECPVELDFQAVQTLRTALSRASSPWHLRWSRLNAITPDATPALVELFAEWCAQPVKLHFTGADILEKTLASFTPAGDKRVDLCWWRLRLDALRILHLQDEFELAALDYCVTYEVSPPPWVDARCDYVQERRVNATPPLGADHDGPDGATADHAVELEQFATVPLGLDSTPATVVELSGEVLGDAAEALDKLQAGLKGSDRLVISCARLIRVDFSAAGSILNWVAARESEGCQVQFRDVPRLVAVFFNVIGINEHARVGLRTS